MNNNANFSSRLYYFEKLNTLNSGLTTGKEDELKKQFRTVAKYLSTATCDAEPPPWYHEIIFVKAKGNLELALALDKHAISFFGCDGIEWDKVFTRPGGWPDLTVIARDVSKLVDNDFQQSKYTPPPKEILDLIG